MLKKIFGCVFIINNIININLYIRVFVNSLYMYHIYQNKYYYINIVLDTFVYGKLLLNKLFERPRDEFVLEKVELYNNLDTKTNVTTYFYINPYLKVIDRDLIHDICRQYNIFLLENNDDIRLKIYFEYNNNKYIIYYPYNQILHNIEEKNYYLPYPMFSKTIIENFKKDIIIPSYIDNIQNKNKFYSLFHIESKDIDIVEINEDPSNKTLREYFHKIRTPFYDYGILYNVPVKLKWILQENNIDLNTFDKLYFRFVSMYLCEEEMDLKDHDMLFEKEHLDKIFISNRMNKILFD